MNTKRSAQVELVNMELQNMIEKMNKYGAFRLKDIDNKQLEGRTPDDFTSDVLLKVLDGTLNWMDAPTSNMEAFLMMSVKGEISNFLKKVGRRDVGIFTIGDTDEYTKEYDERVKYSNPNTFNSLFKQEQNR